MEKTFYFIDIYIRNGKVTRFYHKAPAGVNVRTGLISSVENPMYKFIRLPTTRECYLSDIKIHKPWKYKQIMKRG